MLSLVRTLRLAPAALLRSKQTRKPNRPLSLSPAHAAVAVSDDHYDQEQWDTPWAIAVWKEPQAATSLLAPVRVNTNGMKSLRSQRISMLPNETEPESETDLGMGTPAQPQAESQPQPCQEEAKDLHSKLITSHMERAWMARRACGERSRGPRASMSGKSANSDAMKALHKAVKNRDREAAIRIFRKQLEQPTSDQSTERQKFQEQSQLQSPPNVPYSLAKQLFHLVANDDPIQAGEIFYYLTNSAFSTETKPDANLVLKMCKSIRSIDPRIHYNNESKDLVSAVWAEIRRFDHKSQQLLFPILLEAITSQLSVRVGRHAAAVYRDIADLGISFTPAQINRLLAASKYNRQDDLPFHELLEKSLQNETMPSPALVGQTIYNMFPYTNKIFSSTAMRAFVQMQARQMASSDGDGHKCVSELYSLSIDTLELIANGAARSACSRTILSVWDVLDQSQISPTASIYESTVVAFANSRDTVTNAFEAMTFMQEEGFPAHRALIRSFSTAIRPDSRTLRRAFTFLQSTDGLRCLSARSLNVILSAYAERGDICLFKSVMDFMIRSGLSPDVDTYSFAIEVIGKSVYRSNLKNKKLDFAPSVNLAVEYLSKMESEGIEPNADVIRNYVELLCLVDELSTAVGVVDDMMASGRHQVVNSKTIYRVAMACTESRRLDDAKRIASYAKIPIPNLEKNIGHCEARIRHVEERQYY